MSPERILTDPERENMPTYHIPEVMVLDFDRMLGDVSACMQRFYTAADLEGIDTERIAVARKGIEDDGGSFEPLSYVKEQLNEDSYRSFCRNFISADGPEVLYPDAQRFLLALQYADVPHIIMTYGANPEWQQLKLRASGYAVGYIITDTPDKGASLMALRSTTGTGEPGTFNMYVAAHGCAKYYAEKLTFIDDKATAFANFPEDDRYKGFWLQRDTLLESQKGSIPRNVEIIHTLDELIITEAGETVVDKAASGLSHFSRLGKRLCPFPIPSTSEPMYETSAVYLPLCEDAMIVEDDFEALGAFWVARQMEHRLGKMVSSGSVDLPQG